MLKALLLTAACLVASTDMIVAGEALSKYREVTLGDSLTVVVARLRLAPADIKVLHAEPALVQEITWRPRTYLSGVNSERDAVASMTFTFHEAKLARILVTYDRERTAGMTDADLQEALVAVYGAATSTPVATLPVTAATGRVTIADWRSGDSYLTLWREHYPGQVGLIVASIDGDRALQATVVEATRLYTAGAPARAKAEKDAAAEAARAREEKTRLDNKARFKPS